MKKLNNKKKTILNYINRHTTLIAYIAVLSIGVLFSLWLLKRKIIAGHDLEFHLSRIKGLKDSILNGDYMALIHVGLNGYGYANGMFYGNLLLYIPAIASIIKFNLINSYKLYTFLCTLGSALTMFWCMKGITKSNKAGLLGSFLYSACAYKACDFIIRAAGGEMGAFVFLPLIILGFYYIVYDDYNKWWIFSIGFFGIIQCHLISSAIIFCFIIIMLIFNLEKFLKDKKRFLYLCISGIIGVLITAAFIFPMLEGLYRNDLTVNANNNFAAWYRTIPIEYLFLGFPHYNTSEYLGRFVPPGVGVLLLVLTAFRFKIKTKNNNIISFCDLCIIMGVISLICCTSIFPWQEITFLNKIQFPWRFYLFASLFFTITSTITSYYYLKNKKTKDIVKFIIPVILIGIIPTAITIYHYEKTNTEDYYNWDGFEIGPGEEYLPKGTNLDKLYKRGKIVTSNNDNINFSFKKTGNSVILSYKTSDYKSDKKTYLELPLLYYYGYAALDKDGNKLKITKGNNNIIRVYPNKVKGKIHVYYKGTIIQKISLWISIITWIIFIPYLCKKNYKSKNKKSS